MSTPIYQQITPQDVTNTCKAGTDWMEVASWPGVQEAARAAIAGLDNLRRAVRIAYLEQKISVAQIGIESAEVEIAALRAEVDTP